MELIWTKEFIESNFVGFHCECKPLVKHNKLFYAFKSIDRINKTIHGVCGVKITVIEINLVDTTSSIKHISFKDNEPKNKKILHTDNWHFIQQGERLYLYVGGEFNNIGNNPRPKLAAIKLSDGTSSTWTPSPNGIVRSLALGGDTLFVGGEFTSINSTSRNRVASYNIQSNTLTAFDPNSNNTVLSIQANCHER